MKPQLSYQPIPGNRRSIYYREARGGVPGSASPLHSRATVTEIVSSAGNMPSLRSVPPSYGFFKIYSVKYFMSSTDNSNNPTAELNISPKKIYSLKNTPVLEC